jgi:protein-S-isoprenylcysteine O-methyltransferase Ste14
VLASLKFKKWIGPRMGKQYKLYRLYYSIFAFVSFAPIVAWLILLPSYKLFATTRFTMIIGSIITLSGFTIMCISNIKYFMQTTGLNALIEEEKEYALMISGIHQFVRHPLYTGTFLFIWGWFILIPNISVLITDVIITVYTLIGLNFEEKKLEKHFGDSYKLYKQRVPALIPKSIKYGK